MTLRARALRAWRRSRSRGSSQVEAAAICSITCSPGRLPLLVFQPALQDHLDQLAQLLRRVDAEAVQELVRQLRQAERLDVLDRQGAPVTVLPRSDGSATALDRLMSTSRVSPALAPLTCSAKFSATPSLKASCLSTRKVASFSLPISRSPSLTIDVGDEEVAELGVALRLGHDLAVGRQQPAFFLRDVLLGEGVDRPADLEALVVGQVELRPNLDLELVDERPLARQLDVGRIDVGARQRGDVVVLGELLQAGQQHLALDLIADLLVEAALDDAARRLAGPEAGHVGVGDQLAELLVEAAVDVLAIDRDLDVLLARADVADLDGLLELDRLRGGGRHLALLMLVFMFLPLFLRDCGSLLGCFFVRHNVLLSRADAEAQILSSERCVTVF